MNIDRARAACALAAAVLAGCSLGAAPPPCLNDAGCAAGHRCTGGTCGASCEQALCAARTECLTAEGDCTAVQCGRATPCEDPTKLCDSFENRCYDMSGSCPDGVCPQFGGMLARFGSVACSAGFCSIQAKPLGGVPGLTDQVNVRITAPAVGEGFADQGTISIRWEWASQAAAIALVLDDVPSAPADILAHAIWGVSRKANSVTDLGWADGVEIRGGIWQRAPSPAPLGKPLYLLVQFVREGQLIAASALVPFRVGAAWPAQGDACTDEGAFPGSCANPAAVQACYRGICRRACLSNRDCEADPSLACGPPRALAQSIKPNVRLCEQVAF